MLFDMDYSTKQEIIDAILDNGKLAFGSRDYVFASHPVNEMEAIKLLRQARSAGLTDEEFQGYLLTHLRGTGSREHVEAQQRRIHAFLQKVNY